MTLKSVQVSLFSLFDRNAQMINNLSYLISLAWLPYPIIYAKSEIYEPLNNSKTGFRRKENRTDSDSVDCIFVCLLFLNNLEIDTCRMIGIEF